MSDTKKDLQKLKLLLHVFVFTLTLLFLSLVIVTVANAETLIEQPKADSTCRITRPGDNGSSIQWFNENANDPNEERTIHETQILNFIDFRVKKGATTTDPYTVWLTQDNVLPFLWGMDFDNSLFTQDYATLTLDFSTSSIYLRPSSTYQLITFAPNASGYQISYAVLFGVGEDYEDGFHVCNLVERGDWTFLVDTTVLDRTRYQSFINIAWASECTFVTNGSTTTSECTDPLIRNQTQDIFNTTVLFIVMIVLTIGALEYLHNKKKKFRD